jgi:hypothetical protein
MWVKTRVLEWQQQQLSCASSPIAGFVAQSIAGQRMSNKQPPVQRTDTACSTLRTLCRQLAADVLQDTCVVA